VNSDGSPLIVGIGGTVRADSSSERALRLALAAAEEAGARTRLFPGAALTTIPIYSPGSDGNSAAAAELVSAVRAADGLVVASPGYHGSLSGLVKNALDHLEELSHDTPPYLTDRAVGCIVTASGWQACGTTLVSMRSIVHALRGWPTPLGVTINSSLPVFDATGACIDDKTRDGLEILGRQVVRFARAFRAGVYAAETS
jgi:FMN reductase